VPVASKARSWPMITVVKGPMFRVDQDIVEASAPRDVGHGLGPEAQERALWTCAQPSAVFNVFSGAAMCPL
jgi:hypothetical protein